MDSITIFWDNVLTHLRFHHLLPKDVAEDLTDHETPEKANEAFEYLKEMAYVNLALIFFAVSLIGLIDPEDQALLNTISLFTEREKVYLHIYSH